MNLKVSVGVGGQEEKQDESNPGTQHCTVQPLKAQTSLAEHPLVNTQVLSSAVLLTHFDLVLHVVQVMGKMHRLAQVHHVHRHSALVHSAPQQWWILDGVSLDFIRSGEHCTSNFLI